MATDIQFLTQKINQETPEFGEAYPFAFLFNHLISRHNYKSRVMT
jgi:hypothetical protein